MNPAVEVGVNASSHLLGLDATLAVCLEDPRAQARRRSFARWPVLLCGLVALAAAAAAFTEGPLAQNPTCAPYASALRVRAVRAGALTVAFTHDLLGR
jgi:hypothetical protein